MKKWRQRRPLPKLTAEGHTKEALEKIKEALTEGRQLITHRQKLLKLADRFEYGWSVVDEYEDGLADDSEDKKRIEKAEQAAEWRAQAKRRKEAVSGGGKRTPQRREAVQQELLRLSVYSGNVTPVEGLIDGVRCWELQTADNSMSEREVCTVKGYLEGYVLPLMSESPPYSRPNPQLAQLESEFVSRDLLAGGYVERSSESPTLCSPLSVVISGASEKQLGVNLWHVNQYRWKQKFKYEDLRVAMTMFSKGDWPLLYDLQKPELQQFARGLPDVVLSGRADSTINKYLSAFQRWKSNRRLSLTVVFSSGPALK
ncbi:hypothetical protein EMCRGX_G003861 [Ephydatia muelleri]